MNVTKQAAKRNVGARLSELIRDSGKSLNAISRESGVDVATLSAMRNGETEASASKLKTLASYFGVSADWLLEEPTHKQLTEWEHNPELQAV